MKYSVVCTAALASLASSTAIDVTRRDTPLEVELTSVGNSKVKAALTNTGAVAYNLMYKGSFLDNTAPVEKFVVSGMVSSADFKGVLLRLKTGDLTQESFMAIAPGQTLETEVDIAELYDVETDDSYTVQAMGAMRYAEAGDTKLAGALDFSSNALVMNINGTEAKEVPYALDAIVKRTRLNTGSCSTARLSAVRTALSNCARLASGAATAATSGSATTFNTFFKSTSSSVRSTVAARFRAIAADCGSTTSGGTTTYCNDPYGYCTSNVLAYAIPSQNIISYCPAFYSYLPALTSTCRAQDQAGTVLHEETHTPGVYSPGTQDYAYGYAASIRLSTSQALLNADSYALFANAIYLRC